MYLKSILLSFAVAGSLVGAHEHNGHHHPNCTIGTNTESCTLPDGGPGMFLCHPRPPHPPHPFPGEHSHHGGGIAGAVLRVVDRITGQEPPHGMDDHLHQGPPHFGHGTQPKGPRGHPDGPHRQLHSKRGSVRHGPHPSWERSEHPSPSRSRRHGPPSWARSSSPSSRRSSSRSGMMMDHHHHGMMGPGPDERRPHGPPGFLSPTLCVPIDGPDNHPHFPSPPPHFPAPSTCGCCGDVCPVKLDCGCTCDLVDHEGNVVDPGAGVWVTVSLKGQTDRSVKKCVHAGAYADTNRVQCVKECSADMVEDEDDDDSIDLLEEPFGEQDDDLEKESRD